MEITTNAQTRKPTPRHMTGSLLFAWLLIAQTWRVLLQQMTLSEEQEQPKTTKWSVLSEQVDELKTTVGALAERMPKPARPRYPFEHASDVGWTDDGAPLTPQTPEQRRERGEMPPLADVPLPPPFFVDARDVTIEGEETPAQLEQRLNAQYAHQREREATAARRRARGW